MNLRPEDAAWLIARTHTERTVLIGGQAVAFWGRYYGIEPELPALTVDIDYLGTRTEAKRVANELSIPHQLRIATFDDATPNAAVLMVELEGRSEPVIIDYLAGIVGVDARAIRKSAVTVEFESQRLRVLHPLQLLQSKVWNLYKLEGKRTKEGVEQARLAIAIAGAYVADRKSSARDLLNAIEAVAKFAATDPARFVRENFCLDCLQAVPKTALDDKSLPPAFHEKRWPQLIAAINRR